MKLILINFGIDACMTTIFVSDLKPIVRTITVKVHMHCDKCEADLKRRLIKHKGNLKTILISDMIYMLILNFCCCVQI